MTETRTKLEESSFFLERLKESQRLHPAFDFYLNAFVSAARSVTWIMRHEYHDVPGWEAWYDLRAVSLDHERVLQGFNTARVRSQKERPLQTAAQISLQLPTGVMTAEMKHRLDQLTGERIIVTVSPVDNSTSRPATITDTSLTFSATLDDVWRVLEEFPAEDILTVCTSYYQFLESIVTECEAQFCGSNTET